MSRPLTVIDLFSGAGGLSLGFHAAGCSVVAAVDIDECAAATLSTNFARLQPGAPPQILTGDEGNLEDLDLSSLSKSGPEILIGGPPCQGFSRLGRAKLDSLSDEGFAGDPRNDLYQRFLDAAELWKPLAVIMENVPGMLSVKGRNVADDAAADLVRRGYRVGYAVLNSVWFGVPQFRERLFFIGLRSDLGLPPVMPPASHRADLPSGYLRPSSGGTIPFPFLQHFELPVNLADAKFAGTTVANAFDDLPAITEHLQADRTHVRGLRPARPYRSPPHTTYARLMRCWPGLDEPLDVHDHVIRLTPRDYGTFARMMPGDRYPEALAIARKRFAEEVERLGDRAPAQDTQAWRELERRFVPPYPVDMFIDKWRKLSPDQPSWTVPAHLSKDAYSHIHPDPVQARAISIREAARLQSFPDAFRFVGNMGDCFRQVGNAVPPLMAWSIASHVLAHLGRPCTAPWC